MRGLDKRGPVNSREPGRRRTATEIIRRATYVNIACAVVIGGLGVVIAAFSGHSAVAVSIATAIGVIAVFHALSFVDTEFIVRWMPTYQGAAFVGSFLLKLLLLALFLALTWDGNWLDIRVFFVTFALAVVGSLVVTSIVVMREQGPAIEDVEIRSGGD